MKQDNGRHRLDFRERSPADGVQLVSRDTAADRRRGGDALGAVSPVHGQLAGGAQGSAVTVRVDGARRITAGETLPLAVAPDRVHFFDSGNGNRLA